MQLFSPCNDFLIIDLCHQSESQFFETDKTLIKYPKSDEQTCFIKGPIIELRIFFKVSTKKVEMWGKIFRLGIFWGTFIICSLTLLAYEI